MEIDVKQLDELARMILMQNLQVVPDKSCVDEEEVHEQLAWKQRLFSLKPWRKVRVTRLTKPSERILQIDNVLFCHPETARPLLAAIDRARAETKRQAAPHIIATDKGGHRHGNPAQD